MGAQGAWLDDGQHPSQHIPALKVDAVDATVAGDTFNGALAEDKPLAEAVVFANAAAAVSVTKLGAQTSIPDRVEVAGFLLAND